MEKCALCGAILTTVEAGVGPVTYCGRCGIEDPPYLPAYDRQVTYMSADGRFRYDFWPEIGVGWSRYDHQDGDLQFVKENDLPFDLWPLAEWQAQQQQADWLWARYGVIEQLPLTL